MSDTDFLHLVEEHQGIIHKVCMIYAKSAEDHEDLFQDVVYQAWKSYKSFKGESKITTWLYRVALYTALAQKKRKKFDPGIYLSEQQFEGLNDTVEEDIRRLYKEIEMLKPIEKAIMILYLEEKSYDEMAEILGLSTSNIGVRINRIKKKLAEKWS